MRFTFILILSVACAAPREAKRVCFCQDGAQGVLPYALGPKDLRSFGREMHQARLPALPLLRRLLRCLGHVHKNATSFAGVGTRGLKL